MEGDRKCCSNDLVDDLFDSIDLLEEVELGDIELSLYNGDTNFETSDSDSGISVSCENTVDKNVPSTASVQLPDSDCVLTDAVGGFVHQSAEMFSQDAVAQLDPPILIHRSNAATPSLRPIRIVKIGSNPVNFRTNHIASRVHKIIPVHSFKSLPTSSKPHSSNEASAFQSLQFAAGPPVHTKSRTEYLETSFNRSSESSVDCLYNPVGSGAFLDSYDPATNPDHSLEMHLREFCGATFSEPDNTATPTVQTTLSSTLTSPSSYLITPSNCVLTHANLERMRKRQVRMIKNRHAASMSRLRKKEYLEKLEMRYEQLKRENLGLWRQNEEWRIRCERLESSLNQLQTQINKLGTSSDDSMDILPPSKQICVQLSTDSRPAVSSHLNTSSSSSSVQRDKNLSSTYMSHDPIAASQISDRTACRKTISSPLVYNIKSVGVSDTNGQVERLDRKNLFSLTGTVSRHRLGHHLNTGRSKLIASSSLLSICCLFALNIVLPPFRSTLSDQLIIPGHVNQLSSHRLQSVAHHPIGQRALLSMPVDDSVITNASDDANTIPSPCAPGSHSDPSSMDNLSFSDSSYAWQQWVIQNNRVNTGSIRSPSSGLDASQEITVSSHFGSFQQQGTSLDKQVEPITKARVRRFAGSTKRRHKSERVSPTDRLSPGLNSSDVNPRPAERGLQPFHLQPTWSWDDLLETAGRRNDTVYLILARLDAIYLHAVDPIYEKPVKKITLIVPAHPALNDTTGSRETDFTHLRRTMLQVECELRNVTLIHPPTGTDG